MGIHIHCDADLAMAKHFLYYFRMDTQAQQHGGRRVAEIVEADIRQTRLRQQFFELRKNIARGVQMPTDGTTKDEVIFLPGGTSLEFGV